MLQIGFGYDALHSGLLLLCVFAGNVSMKSMTRPILRRYGYRSVMIWNGLLSALTLATCATFTATTPTAVIAVVLVLGGMSRSMQFTTIGNIAIADVPKAQMPDANSIIITVAQVSMAAGVTLGALGVRVGHWIAENSHLDSSGVPFRIAFLVVALFALLGLRDAIGLERGAADHFLSR